MCIYGSIEVHYFEYLVIIIYDYIVMHLNFRENYAQIVYINAYHFTAPSRCFNVCSTFL